MAPLSNGKLLRARLVAGALMLVAVACSNGGATSRVPSTTAISEENGMELTSSAFVDSGTIPDRYTCKGEDISPPLSIGSIPSDTVSLTLVMDDPDAPGGVWDHWVSFDIEPREKIPADVGGLGTEGNNSWGRTGYGGPCPPSGTHRYYFTVYALDTNLGLVTGSGKQEVLDALEGHVLARATLMGRVSH